jgi:hypothetical protein
LALYYSNIYVHSFINNMKTMRKCNNEIYQLAKDRALVKNVSDPTSRRFIRWLLFQTFIYMYIYIYEGNTSAILLNVHTKWYCKDEIILNGNWKYIYLLRCTTQKNKQK